QLLDTYDAERRPIAWLRHEQTFARPDYKSDAVDKETNTFIIDDDAMEFGQLYRSTAVIGTDAKLPPALRIEQWAGQPGTRAPHLWMTRNDKQISTLDLFGHNWVLLTEDERWIPIARSVSKQLNIKLSCHHIGSDVDISDSDGFRKA